MMVRYCLCGWVVLCVDVLAMCAVHSQKGSQSGSLDSFGLLFPNNVAGAAAGNGGW